MAPPPSPEPRRHRGAHGEDARLFSPRWLSVLRAATTELSWLLGRGYPPAAALKLVGDRHRLRERQRRAVSRAACSEERRQRRAAACIALEDVRGEALSIDGFNLLITMEAALGGGVLLRCRDGCIRDLSSVHGSYRSVQETDRALHLIGEALAPLAPRAVTWLLDRPIANSGRLAQRLRDLAAQRDWPWSVELPFNPDAVLLASPEIAITSDSTILDGATRWVNLAAHLVAQLPGAWVVDMNE
jgi:hypothetical protein